MRRILVFVGILAFVFFNGCTVQKKKGEVSTIAKIYHNTTSLYNGYFNADVLMQDALLTLETQHQDNFTRLLPLYPYSAAANPKAVAENMDKAIEKVSIVATIHEPGQWVDDCYVLLGKAQYLKQDYEAAEKTFEFFVDEFDPLNKRKSKLKEVKKKTSTRKKTTKRPTKNKKAAPKKKTKKPASKKKKKKASSKKGKPGSKKRPAKTTDKTRVKTTDNAKSDPKKTSSDATASRATKKTDEVKNNPPNISPSDATKSSEKSGMFGHKPVYQEGLLWLAKTYIQRERFSLADYYLNKVLTDPSSPKEVMQEALVAKAYYAIQKKNFNDAVPALEKAIASTKDKNIKARYTFIVAQLHQMSGRQDMAFAAYNQVIKMHPYYEMEFNAQLNLAKAAWASGQEKSETIMKRLERMAKEDKNYNYRDQIYFTMGTINLKLKERDLAIENFRKSIKYNVGNGAQSSESYYALASFFYEEEEYDDAKYHYDSTLIDMAKNDERYDDVKMKSENLKDIAYNLSIIKLQDSLLRVSLMSPERQREIAASLKKKQEVSAQPKTGLRKGLAVNAPAIAVNGSATTAKKSNYFAYDLNKVRRGQNEFRKKWGSRSLEDDWRRSNKPTSSINSNTSEKEIAKRMTDDEVKSLLKDIPFSPQQKQAANTKIEEAHFQLGKLFRSKLEQPEKSVDNLEQLLVKNNKTKYLLETYYYLYLSNKDLNNTQRSNFYLDKLKSEFPDSKYTLSIIDPLYAQKQLDEAKKIERSYDKAYAFFQSGQYQESFDLLKQLSGGNDKRIKGLLAKIDLLTAMCEGNLNGQDAYITALNYVVKKHPKTPEEVRAKEILRFIKGDNQAFDPILYDESTENFEFEPEKLHYVLVTLFSSKSKDMTTSKIEISAFNQKYFKDEKLKTSSIFLNKEEGSQIILIRKFRNKDQAMEYFDKTESDKSDFVKVDAEYEVFAVTQKTYREIVKQRSVNSYRVFFERNYLSAGE